MRAESPFVGGRAHVPLRREASVLEIHGDRHAHGTLAQGAAMFLQSMGNCDK